MSFRKIILVMAALLICSVPVAAYAEENLPVAADPRTAPCKDLKPFNNIDELMYQIYTNLDNDCLFKMDPEELAEIWRLPTINYRGFKSPPAPRERRPPAEGDHYYLLFEVFDMDENPDTDYFIIRPGYGFESADYPFFTEDVYPKRLPEPLICGHTYQHLVWPNSDKTKMVYLSWAKHIQMITVADFVFADKFENCYYETER